jgi:Cu-processing system permease protein
MNKIFVISKNTFKELMRNRVLYAFIVFAIFLVFLTVAVGQLSHAEQFRLTVSLGLGCIHLCIAGLTIFLGGAIIYKEVERLTILTLLSRPISRTQFLLGKYFGFAALLVVFTLGFLVVFLLNLLLLGFNVQVIDFLPVFFGIILEALILLAITTFFSTFCASFLTILFSICFFLVGHWNFTVPENTSSSDATVYYTVISYVKRFLPNFEYFNWRINPIEAFVTPEILFSSMSIAIAWIVTFLCLGALIFRRKDFA